MRRAALALLLAVPSTQLLGQFPGDPPRAPGEQVGALPPGELERVVNRAPEIRVRTRHAQVVVFRPRLSSDQLAFERVRRFAGPRGSAGPEATLPLSEVVQIQIPAGSQAGKGAAIGGGIGATLMLLLGVLAAGDGWGTPTGGQVFGATLVIGAGGAAIGALIGSHTRKWRTVYAAPPAL